jgi:geranylgeranyl diphosphate synthase type II
VAFDLPAYLETRRLQVEQLLRERMEARKSDVPARLFEAMTYSLYDGGKRLRPVLCLSFAEALGGSPAQARSAACALEMVHTYSLIHDDLPAMDNDDLRRGRPTNHKVHGDGMAILAGDALLTEAFSVLASEPRGALLVAELAQAAGPAGMVGGQVLDISEDRPAELGYLSRMHALKTGRLLRAACRMGAMSANASPEALDAAGRYGEHVGLAFQVMDDVLDVTATAQTLGKPTGADAAAGRVTYPALLGLDGARRKAHEEIQRAKDALH